MDNQQTIARRHEVLQRILEKMMSQAIDAIIVTDLAVIRWLTGFSGSNARLLITRGKSWFFTDFRYQEQAAYEVTVAETVIVADGFAAELGSGRYLLGETVALQSDNVTWHEATMLVEQVLGRQRVIPVDSFFNEFRMLKNEIEIMNMRCAADISERTLEMVLPMISPSVTELDIAAEITYQQKKLGAERDAFEPIVASGARSAMPHAAPSKALFKAGEMIIIDIGCVYQGYSSDQTRTVALGHVSAEARKVYRIVQEAQELGIASAKCGMKAKELDAEVRHFISNYGYADQFGHGLGHGVGLNVHEEPRISPKGERELQENMVFTVEPGIYLSGKFGIRIEDTVVMGADGATPLQRFSKELVEL